MAEWYAADVPEIDELDKDRSSISGMDILRRVDKGVRLSEEEVVWLSTEHDESYTGYFTEELKEGYHLNSAIA